jgi:hypothetical protein
VARCEARHAGWRVLRQAVVDAHADVPWERCARRAVPATAAELIELATEGGHTPLSIAQHVAAGWRAEEIAPHVDPPTLLTALEIAPRAVAPDRWRAALRAGVRARSREQLARVLDAQA